MRAVSKISTTGRIKATEWVVLQDDTGKVRAEREKLLDPLDYGFKVKSIIIDDRKFVGASYNDSYRETTLDSQKEERFNTMYECPHCKSFENKEVFIIHGV